MACIENKTTAFAWRKTVKTRKEEARQRTW